MLWLQTRGEIIINNVKYNIILVTWNLLTLFHLKTEYSDGEQFDPVEAMVHHQNNFVRFSLIFES